jgi:hypothetical protein
MHTTDVCHPYDRNVHPCSGRQSIALRGCPRFDRCLRRFHDGDCASVIGVVRNRVVRPTSPERARDVNPSHATTSDASVTSLRRRDSRRPLRDRDRLNASPRERWCATAVRGTSVDSSLLCTPASSCIVFRRGTHPRGPSEVVPALRSLQRACSPVRHPLHRSVSPGYYPTRIAARLVLVHPDT